MTGANLGDRILSRLTPFRKSSSSPQICSLHTTPSGFVRVTPKMGKSNKFDYTNRPNSGEKLGTIIGSALVKEAEKVQKDADRHLQKARKQSISGDSAASSHLLDLKVPSKDLGDDGACALADGLEEALRSGSPLGRLSLVDLNLASNGVTTTTLARLAPIIKLAKLDLQTINLSGNKIKVDSDERAAEWETFLEAFGCCLKLRRLDLSGNNELGSRALEILARVHTREPHIDPLLPGGETSVQSLASVGGDEEAERPAHENIDLAESCSIINPNMSSGQVIRRHCGLRSLPYITLHDIGMDDSGALWLSYVLQDHHYPNQLMDERNATSAESTIKTYQQDAESRGIDWTGNESIGKDGMHLLQKTEAFRQQAMLDDNATIASSSILQGEEDAFNGPADSLPGRSSDRRSSRVTAGDRRVSIRSIRTDDGGEHEATELESIRRRIQRFIIGHDSTASVELWKTALQAFRTSRLLLFVAPVSRNYHRTSSLPSAVPRPSGQQPVAHSYASTLAANVASKRQAPVLAMTDITNRIPSVLATQKSKTRKDSVHKGDTSQLVTEKLITLNVKDDKPDRFLQYQQRRNREVEQRGSSFRNERSMGQLPMDLVEYIVSFAMSKRETKMLGQKHMMAAISWGQRKETLTAEREWLKKDESAQLWMLLDSMQCLAYRE